MSKKNVSKRDKDPEPSQHEEDPEANEEEEEAAAPTGHDESLRALAKPIMAEFIGCFFFLYVSCGAAMSTGAKFETPGTVEIGIALSFGFTIFVIAFTLGHISGAHLNCSVSIALACVGKISWKRCAAYFFCAIFWEYVWNSNARSHFCLWLHTELLCFQQIGNRCNASRWSWNGDYFNNVPHFSGHGCNR